MGDGGICILSFCGEVRIPGPPDVEVSRRAPDRRPPGPTRSVPLIPSPNLKTSCGPPPLMGLRWGLASPRRAMGHGPWATVISRWGIGDRQWAMEGELLRDLSRRGAGGGNSPGLWLGGRGAVRAPRALREAVRVSSIPIRMNSVTFRAPLFFLYQSLSEVSYAIGGDRLGPRPAPLSSPSGTEAGRGATVFPEGLAGGGAIVFPQGQGGGGGQQFSLRDFFG